MSHEELAQGLSRWLDQPPGTDPPDTLEPDVIEAVYALRPDLAPAPRLSADDILASVTSGPLALSAHSETPEPSDALAKAEVVPFPGAPAPEAEPRPHTEAPRRQRGRFALWIGGTSSAGLALVAAATLLLVIYPPAGDLEPSAPHGAAGPTEAGQAPHPAAEVMLPAPAPSQPTQADRADRVATRRARPANRASAGGPEEDLYEMGEGDTPARGRQLIPELAGQLGADDGVAAVDLTGDEDESDPGRASEALGLMQDLEAAAQEAAAQEATAQEATAQEAAAQEAAAQEAAAQEAAAQGATAQKSAPDPMQPAPPSAGALAAARAAAVAGLQAPQGWRGGLDAQTIRAIDDVLARAEALEAQGDLSGAAGLLDEAIQPPAAVAQHLAARSAELYLRSTAPAAAAAVARKGLSYSSTSSAGRSKLLVLLGDALAALGDPSAALDAYQQASLR